MRGKPKLIGSPLFWRLSILKSTVKPAPLFVTAQLPEAPESLRGNCAFSQSASSFVEIVLLRGLLPFPCFIGAVLAGSAILTEPALRNSSGTGARFRLLTDRTESRFQAESSATTESPTRPATLSVGASFTLSASALASAIGDIAEAVIFPLRARLATLFRLLA